MSLSREMLYSIIRKLMVLTFGVLVGPLILHGWFTSATGAKIEGNIDTWAGLLSMTLLTFVVPILWGVWNKIALKAKLIIAAYLSPTVAPSTPEKLAIIQKEAAALPAMVKLSIAVAEPPLPVSS